MVPRELIVASGEFVSLLRREQRENQLQLPGHACSYSSVRSVVMTCSSIISPLSSFLTED